MLVLDHDVWLALNPVQNSNLKLDLARPLVAANVVLDAKEEIQKAAALVAFDLTDAREQVPRNASHIKPIASVDFAGGHLGESLQLPIELDLRSRDVQLFSELFDRLTERFNHFIT